ncbi:hypothetical protein R1flu_006222 [Riccia fluitans]|uniref:DUF599 domain-containing protein n=1 Tax=Riccia fluitans TaxID=41844 RepID=A0ABD1YVE7_9MARC
MAWKLEYLDIILAPLAFGLMIAYNVQLYFRFSRHPESTVMGVNNRARRAWVREIMRDNDKKNILAVQTLRNSIMGSTLLATTAILLSSAVAAFLASSYDVRKPIHNAIVGAESSSSVAIKYICLMTGFLLAFLCYVQAVRYTNHVNFIINVPVQGDITPDYVADILEKGSNFHTMGTRAFYCMIPVLLWLFGPISLLVSVIILVPIWYVLDCAHNLDDKKAKSKTNGRLSIAGNGDTRRESCDHLSRSEPGTEERDPPPVCGLC